MGVGLRAVVSPITFHQVRRIASAVGRVGAVTVNSAPDASVAARPNVDGHMNPIDV